MNATVFLARHGRHDEINRVLSGRSDIELNADGQNEAYHLGTRLAEVPLEAIYSSPRRRAISTAEAVAAPRGLSIRVLDGLDEIDFGWWAGEHFGVLANDPMWQRWNAARSTAATPTGETMTAVVARALAAIKAIASAGAVLCVSHCDVIRGVVADVLGVSADRLFTFDIDCGSLTTLTVDGDQWRLVTLNERPQ